MLNQISTAGKQNLFIISGIIVSLAIVFLSVTLALQRTSFSGRAQTTSTSILLSIDNSYIFASPISASADGASIVRITVFVLNNQGLGIPGQTVKLNTSGPVKINPITPVTDNFGRATFDLTCQTAGSYTISAEVSGVALSQKVSVSFR